MDELLIDQLREAARFARSRPDETIADVARLCNRLWALEGLAGGLPTPLACRLANNLAAGVRFTRSNPDMLAAYCRAAADELESFIDRRTEDDHDW
jgi:hypothetical protein